MATYYFFRPSATGLLVLANVSQGVTSLTATNAAGAGLGAIAIDVQNDDWRWSDGSAWWPAPRMPSTIAARRGDLIARTARFAATTDVAAYNATHATFLSAAAGPPHGLTEAQVTFDLSQFAPTQLAISYVGDGTAPLAPTCLVIVSDEALSADAAASIMGTQFFTHDATPAELIGGDSVTMTSGDASAVFVLGVGDSEAITFSAGASYVYAAAVDDGTGTGFTYLKLQAFNFS